MDFKHVLGAIFAFVLAFGTFASGKAQSSCAYTTTPTAETTSSGSFTVTPSNSSCSYGIFSYGEIAIDPTSGTGTQTFQYASFVGSEAYAAIGTFGSCVAYFCTFSGQLTFLTFTDPSANSSSLAPTSFTIPNTVVGRTYSPLQLQATGGTPPYTWNCLNCNGTPYQAAGPLTVSSTGLVTSLTSYAYNGGGTASEYATNPTLYTLYINLTDAAGNAFPYALPYESYPAGYSQPSTPATPTLIDPMQGNLLSTTQAGASSIKTNFDALASSLAAVSGVAADGVAQLLVRLPAASVGDKVTFTLLDETGAIADPALNGGLFMIGSQSSGATASLSITAVQTASGPFAFAGYIAPIDFARSAADYTLPSRSLSLVASVAGVAGSPQPLLIARPLVFLVHGLWADPSSWKTFTDVTADSSKRFVVSYADYSGEVDGVTAVSPSDSHFIVGMTKLHKNALGFAFNAPYVEAELRESLKAYRKSLNVAAAQADVIGHSMGGNVIRTAGLRTDFIGSDTYGAGLIHKAITIGTPHLGSALATRLLDGSSSCSRWILSGVDSPMFSFDSVTIGSAPPVTGAVHDLEDIPSDAITDINSAKLPFPIAYLAGTSIQGSAVGSNWVKLDQGFKSNSTKIRDTCVHPFIAYVDYLANALTPTGWSTVFQGAQSDSIVALNSQLNGNPVNADLIFNGLIHSPGIEELDFLPPSELDHGPGLDTKVVTLLNEPTNNSDFHGKGEMR